MNQAKELAAVRVGNAPEQLKVVLQTYVRTIALAALSYNKHIVASSEQYCSFVSVSSTYSSFATSKRDFFHFNFFQSFRNQIAIEYLRKFVQLSC